MVLVICFTAAYQLLNLPANGTLTVRLSVRLDGQILAHLRLRQPARMAEDLELSGKEANRLQVDAIVEALVAKVRYRFFCELINGEDVLTYKR